MHSAGPFKAAQKSDQHHMQVSTELTISAQDQHLHSVSLSLSDGAQMPLTFHEKEMEAV